MQFPRIPTSLHALRVAIPLALVFGGAALFQATETLEAENRSPFPVLPVLRYDERAVLPTAATPLLDQARLPKKLTLLPGEKPAGAFRRLGLEAAEASHASEVLAADVGPQRLKAGDRFAAFLNPDATLASLDLLVSGAGRYSMVRDGDDWQTDWQPFVRSRELHVLRGKLEGGLESSIRAAGGPGALTYKVAEILRWDLDFARDLKRGDRFEVVYEALHLDGEFHAMGPIWAVRYASQGRVHEAYRYGDSDTFYDGEGRPLKKMFLRSPLRYSRVTSNFSQHRFHPVLKIFRPHYGVDYGAPVGTPVEVTANGLVQFAGWDRGGGKVVKIRHAGGYMTAYLHLSRFAAGIRPGARVRQGDTIAFTGATGLASGPHLDYRVQLNDRWIDPLGLKGVRDEAIPRGQLASFRTVRDQLRQSCDSGVVSAALRLGGAAPPAARLAVGKVPESRSTRPGNLGGIAR
jgi:murein DD-endopeptidase MepM/ murein hydrolase activator NlpD